MRATSNDVPEASKERWGPFYHYTNKEGADGINKSGTLRSTEMRDYIDAAGGEGIYVTDMDPWNHSKADILTNNYGKETEDNEDKADYYVKFYVTKERWNVKKVRDHVFVITDKKGNGKEMRVTGSDILAYPKPAFEKQRKCWRRAQFEKLHIQSWLTFLKLFVLQVRCDW